MFHLARSVYKHWNLREQHDILILGLDGSGKTSFIETLKAYLSKPSKALNKIQPTIGQNVSFVSMDTHHIWKIIDVSGQESFRYLWDSYFNKENIHGIVYMVDTSEPDRLQESINELQARYVNNPAAVDIPIAVVLNKTDQCLDVSSFIDRFTELMIDLDVKRSNVFQITTAQPNDLQEPSEWLRTQLQENKDLIPPSYR
ncbi:Arl3 [Kluyveromyces lactis]|nr:Arl3 [Kluyveromyces lactis]